MPLESTDIQQERPETPDNAIEYTVGEADDSCQTENTDDSTDTADHDGERWLSDEGSAGPSQGSRPSSSATATSTEVAVHTGASAAEPLSTGCTSCDIAFSMQRL
ncbi:hypothetical protein LDENG_00044790 [Lucifuga dentata]|nr:hypothetical protein LDENG_00044790 [Lucifuga dentata]